MRVGFVVPRFYSVREQGGITGLMLFIKGLQKRGVECSLLAFDGKNFEKRHAETLGNIEVKQGACSSNPLLGFLAKLRSIRKFSKTQDLLHFFNIDLNLTAGCFSIFSKKKIVVYLNNYAFFYPLKISLVEAKEPNFIRKRTIALQNLVKRKIVMQCDSFVCESNSSRIFYEKLGFDPQKICIIPEMVDDLFKYSYKEFNGKRVLYAGVLIKDKGVEYLIRAMGFVQSPKAELWIVGSGAEEDRLKTLTRKLGLENKIRFFGWIPHSELPKIYSECDVFVHPGIWIEPFGRTLLEAMQSGLPVIATKIGAPEEIIKQKELLCEPKNPEQLAEKIDFVLSNRKYAEKIVKENIKYAVREYSEEKVTNKLMGLYKYLLSSP